MALALCIRCTTPPSLLAALGYLETSEFYLSWFSNVTEMNCDPVAGIARAVQSKEPGDKLCLSIDVHAEGALPLRPHIYQ